MNKLIANITGVVMAGGKSSRMGTDKGLMLFKGKPMVQHAIELLSSIFENVVISTNNTEYSKFGLPPIPDIHKNCGPIGGLHSSLNAINTDYAFVLSCDMPFMNRNTIYKIIENYNNYKIISSKLKGKMQPLCSLYSKNLFAEIESRIQDKNHKLYDLINSSSTLFVTFVDEKPFININSPVDIATNN